MDNLDRGLLVIFGLTSIILQAAIFATVWIILMEMT